MGHHEAEKMSNVALERQGAITEELVQLVSFNIGEEEFVKGVGKLDDRLLILLDVGRILYAKH
jgi:chemotaxis signal transduction protein